MSDDLVKRLREAASGGDVFVSPGQAADEIQKLQKRIAELEAENKIMSDLVDCIADAFGKAGQVIVTETLKARAALEGKGNE